MRSEKFAWVYPVLWALLLFILSSIPDLSFPEWTFDLSDKILHMIFYIPLGFLLGNAITHRPGPFKKAPVFWSVFVGIAYGVADEIHQYFVPGRFMDIFDVGADAAGVFIGSLLFLLRRELLRSTEQRL